MINSNKHIINKVFLEINTNSKEKGYYLKDNIDAFLQKEIFPFLENYFNEVDSKNPSHSIQLDKLNIDIAINQNLDFEDFKEQILKKVITQVEEVFEKEEKSTESYKLIHAQEKEIESFFYFLETGTNAWWTALNHDFKTIVNTTFDEVLNDKAFPFKWANAVQKPIVRARFIKQFSDNQIAAIITKGILLKKNNAESSAKIIRISAIKKHIEASVSKNQLTPNQRFSMWEIVVLSLLETRNPMLKQKISKLICSVFELHKKNSFLEHKELFLQEIENQIEIQNELELLANLDAVVSVIKNKAASIILKEKVTGIKTIQKNQESIKTEAESESETKPKTKTETKGKTEAERENEIQKETETERIQQNNEKEVSDMDFILSKNKDATVQSDNENIAPLSNNSIEKTLNTQEEVMNKKDFSIEKEEKENTKEDIEELEESLIDANVHIDTNVNDLYVQNAGLLLIHPFLKSLFENCGLLNKDNTINNPEIAAHLLHYIATGQEQDYENTMAFEKFLCNIPIAQPIERNIILSEKMKKEAATMLQAVLSNWDVMKKSSAELLQNEFLQRPGKLNINGDESPVILIERKTQDVLLDKLSWNLSIVKLAWKKRIIYVNW